MRLRPRGSGMNTTDLPRWRVRAVVGRMTDAELLTLAYRVRVNVESLAWITAAQAEAARRGLYAKEYFPHVLTG